MYIRTRKIYDVCVIGSGAAGGFMVKELTAAGADTILLEAGSRGRLEDLMIHDWPYQLPKRGFGLFKQASLYPDAAQRDPMLVNSNEILTALRANIYCAFQKPSLTP